MPSNYTTNYQLNQWAKSDQVKMEDFNADNAKIDAAIKAVDQRVDGLSASKADQTTLSVLAQTVAEKGNCQIVLGQYTGNGRVGQSYSNRLSFDHTVALLLIHGQIFTLVAPGNAAQGHVLSNGDSRSVIFTWEGNTVSWYHYDDPGYQMNTSGIVYHYTAFLAL